MRLVRPSSIARLVVVALAALALGLSAATAASASSPDGRHFRVPYSFAPGIVAATTNPTADPPGANDWSCKPTARHPEPVVLVHGLLGTKGSNWQTFAPLLANEGYCVYALTYGQATQSGLGKPFVGGLERMEDSAKELDAFVARVLASTGAKKVDLLGHSEGSTMPHYWIKYLGGASKVDRYVNLTPIYRGTTLGGISTLNDLGTAFGFRPVIDGAFAPSCASCTEFLKGSAYNRKMQSGAGIFSPQVQYTNIVTKYDELVTPYTSGIAQGPNITNVVLQDVCATDYSEHLTVAADPVAAQIALNALDPTRRKPVTCSVVLPVLGSSLL